MRRRTFTAFAVVLAVVGIAAPASAQQEPRLPTELWEEYPLDPTATEKGEQAPAPPPPPQREPTATTGADATSTVSDRAQDRQKQPRTVRGERAEGTSIVFLALAILGTATAAGVVLSVLIVVWHRSPRARPFLGSEAGSLAPVAERGPSPEPAPEPHPPRPSPPGPPQPAAPIPVDAAAPPEHRPRKKVVPAGAPPPAKRLHGRELPSDKKPPGLAPQADKTIRRERRTRKRRGREAHSPEGPQSAAEPAPPLPAPEPSALPASRGSRWETCEIDWWRGYLKSDFYATAVRPGASPYLAGRSPMFRWHREETPPKTGSPARAHARLVESLAAEGWKTNGTFEPWYRTKLRRPVRTSLLGLADDSS